MTAALGRRISEAALEELVIDYARIRRWHVHAERRARTKTGWRTPIKGHAGYPDLTLARAGFLIFAELKTETAPIPIDQRAWLEAINGHPLGHSHDHAGAWILIDPRPIDHYAVLWRPSDWPTIEAILR